MLRAGPRDEQTMRPICFNSTIGWLHEPARGAPRLDRVVVIASPHGFEELASRRALRMLGERLAAAGVAALRFDWSGASDALGDATDPDRLAAWRADLDAAMDIAKRASGAGEVAVVGFRFGALMAAELGARRAALARVALLAPPPSGRGYVRELRALARVMAPQSAGVDPSFTGVSVAGFRISRETMNELAQWCFSDLAIAPARDVRIVAPEDSLGAGVAERRLSSLAPRVSRVNFPGYDRMMCDPTASEVAFEILDPLVEWLAEGAGPATRAPDADAGRRVNITADFTEEPVCFGENGRFAGVLCRPTCVDGGTPVVFLNAGGSHHVGWARMTVTQARQLAARGVASLRIDLPGVGDSGGGEERARQYYYLASQRDAISAALDLLERRGYRQARLMGACSGAHHAFHAADGDARVVGALMVNLQLFVWEEQRRFPLDAWMNSRAFDVSMRTRVADAETALLARLRARLMVGAIAIAKTSARKTFALLRGAQGSRAETAPDSPIPEVVAQLARMSERGLNIVFVFGEDDAGRTEFETYFGPDGAQALALPGVSMRIICDTDHPVTPDAARARLQVYLEEWCGLDVDGAAASEAEKIAC